MIRRLIQGMRGRRQRKRDNTQRLQDYLDYVAEETEGRVIDLRDAVQVRR